MSVFATRDLQRLRFTREALAKSLKAAAIEERTKALEVLQSVFEPDAWTPSRLGFCWLGVVRIKEC